MNARRTTPGRTYSARPEPERRLAVAAVRAAVALILVFSAGCTVVLDGAAGDKSIYVLGFARVKIPGEAGPTSNASVVELSGVGVSIGSLVQLGYFKEFRVKLRPGTDSAVIIVNSKSEREHLERVLSQLNERNLCIISKN